MREVAVLGVGQSQFGKLPERSVTDLGREAAMAAIKDSGLKPKDIQVAYTARIVEPMVTGQTILKEVGVTDIEMINVENACAGGSTAVRGLWKDIAAGFYDVGIAIGVESMTTSTFARQLIPPAKDDLDGQLGLTMPGIFALLARRQMDEHGATLEDFAQVSVKNHHHGCLNPMAQYQKEFTVEEVLASRMIVDPITLLMCCPNTDGAAAVIMCSMDVARKHTTNPIKVAGSVLLSADYTYRQDDITRSPLGGKAARMAYEMSGVGPEDLDLVELHEAFAPEEILRYEDLGLCKPGQGVDLLRSGATWVGGKIPVNPSGGLLALGHPLSASGVRTVCEVALHLRGQAGKRQTPEAKVGLAHMLGGAVAGLEAGACGIHILTR
ncbi:MAG: thiolase family protein [Proteobacteria bacterium]|nr:thiolase family protein [Pseudomonadota bacterium]